MCGIIITKDPERIPLLQHRGIESCFVQYKGFFLGHHRLPIQTEIGDKFVQPLRLKNGGYLLYNGEIFNYPEKFSSDVEYLLKLFNSRNINEILEEANLWDGFWAIVHVTENGMIYCFTDPLGKKQLYYNSKGEICSEITPLVRNQEYDPLFKSRVIKFGYNTDDSTAWKGIKRIIPNSLVCFASGKILTVRPYKYYNWYINIPTGSLKDLLYSSVQRRLISKTYNIGCLVSGGLDSAIIARILKDLGARVNLYSIENGESEYARELAQFLGLNISFLNYDLSLPGMVKEDFKWNESPIDLGSVIPQHRIMSVIPEKIVLTGDGADELFGGYRRINSYDSQHSDIFDELTYYHLPRLDRASMRYTIELRNPFLGHDIIKYALMLPYDQRKNKKILKEEFKGMIPDSILYRDKKPLKSPLFNNDRLEVRLNNIKMFYGS